MARPKRKRRIQQAPKMMGFTPVNVKEHLFDGVELYLEEYESLRLADYKGLSQAEAAELMKISRPTFTRIYESARRKMVTALVENKSLLIGGGQVDFEDDWYRCHDCEDVFSGQEHDCDQHSEQNPNLEHINSSLNKGLKNQEMVLSVASLGFCECPDCHYQQRKIQGEACHSLSCPKCGRDQMVRLLRDKK